MDAQIYRFGFLPFSKLFSFFSVSFSTSAVVWRVLMIAARIRVIHSDRDAVMENSEGQEQLLPLLYLAIFNPSSEANVLNNSVATTEAVEENST